MLHTVMRPSIDSASMAGPQYSTMWPWPPAVPILAMSASTRSLPLTPSATVPSTRIRIVRSRSIGSVWVARTCSTCDVPIPKASAPKAPWVVVWLSQHTIVIPGWVSPSSGAMTCTIPCWSAPSG
jgi:hypothetical protein